METMQSFRCGSCGAPSNPYERRCEYCGSYFLPKDTQIITSRIAPSDDVINPIPTASYSGTSFNPTEYYVEQNLRTSAQKLAALKDKIVEVQFKVNEAKQRAMQQ